MLISAEYKSQVSELHRNRSDWGTTARKFAPTVQRIIGDFAPLNVLDYGCGKQTLGQALPHYRIRGYDPGMPGLDDPPEPHDLVVCLDVLEHIEPECLEDVLDDLQRLARKNLFVQVSTAIAIHKLPDGRNAHLIIKPARWWMEKLWDRFDLFSCFINPNGFTALFTTKDPKGNGNK